MAVKIDLPTLAASGEAPLLLDDNFKFYQAQRRGDPYVYVEKYAQKKQAYEPLPLGTASNIRPNYYLDKQTNYMDIGGGFVEFERHFARVPDSWFDYESIGLTVDINLMAVRSINSDAWGTRFRGAMTTSPDSDTIIGLAMILRFNSQSGGSTSTFLSKATRNYYLESDLTGISLNQNVGSLTKAYFFNTTDVTLGAEPSGFITATRSQRIAIRPGVDTILDTLTTANPALPNLPQAKADEVNQYLSTIYEVKTFSLPSNLNGIIGSDSSNLFKNSYEIVPTDFVETISV